MNLRTAVIALSILLLLIAGCRSGEYTVDLEIYEEMPALLAAGPSANDMARNDDGSIKVEFDKGWMLLSLREGRDMDEDARNKAVSDALEIFHQRYLDSPHNRKKDGSFFRKVIGVKGFVGDIELYVIEWDLSLDHPNVLNNRAGNFF